MNVVDMEPYLLLVTSPPLACEATMLLQKYYQDGHVLVWEHGSGPESARRLSKKLFAINPQMCISFYNDYIFNRREISDLPCLVNIHPALPALRGRGYDTLPILERHSSYGATLHFVSEQIDAGPIIQVVSRPMPKLISYRSFRRMTQLLSLEVLEKLLKRCRQTGLVHMPEELRKEALRVDWQWSGPSLTTVQLAFRLRQSK